jgi:formylmethanofuran dehydrogenase subunit D
VRLSSSEGSIVVKVKSKKDLRKGLIFIPYGPWANYLIPSNTDSVGMPSFKGIKVNLKPTNEEALDLFKFLSSSYKKKGVVNNL